MLVALLSSLSIAAELPVLSGAPLKTGAQNPNDAAIVIGIEDYLRVADVPGAAADAKLMRDFLVYTRGVQPAKVRMITSSASREVILGALQDMAHQVGSGGTLWFYFAGHGGAAPNGERLLLGDDVPTAPEALQARSVSVSEIKKLGARGGSQLMLVIDACYNGSTRQGGSVLEGGTRFVVPTAAISQVKGVAEWNAAGPQELARPLPGTGHGAFTYFWVGAGRGWADGQLDGKKDGTITAEESQEYIAQALASVGITSQNPQLTADSPRAWTLVKGAKEPGPDLASAIPAPPPPPPEIAVPKSSGGSTDFAAMAAEAARADAEARSAAERAEKMKRVVEDERTRRLGEARTSLLARAEKDWASVKPLLKTAGSATRKVVETFVSAYGEATVTLDDTVIVVPVPQVAEAVGWIEEQDRAAFTSSRVTASAGSRVLGSIPEGSRVRIDEISADDAYYSTREGMLGLLCRTDSATNHNGDGWQGGPVSCDNGQSYYFYQAALVPVAGAAPTVASASASMESDLPAGARVRITDISSDDAYYPGRELVGLTCTATAGTSHHGGGYHGGPFTCDNGSDYYFYKAALVMAGSAPLATGAGEDLGSTVAEGRSVRIVEVATDDAYYSSRASLIGQTCAVSGDLHQNDGTWYGGGVVCETAGYLYFYKARFSAIATVAAAPTAGSGSASDLGDRVASGTRLKIASVSSDDAYFSDRTSLIGDTCTAGDGMTRQTGTWYSGPVECEKAGSLYFFQGGFTQVGSAPSGGGGTLDTSRSVPKGTRVVLGAVSTEDAYYADRASIEGKSCTTTDATSHNGGGFHGGAISCDDGTSYFFYKVKLGAAGSSGASKRTSVDLGNTVRDGTRVRIAELGTSDAFYEDRAGLVGKACTVTGELKRNGGNYYSGPLTCEGAYFYFAYVGLEKR